MVSIAILLIIPILCFVAGTEGKKKLPSKITTCLIGKNFRVHCWRSRKW